MTGDLMAQAGRRRLPPQPSSVREARRLVRETLVGAERDDLVETAELLVSELVTNALVHAGTSIDVGLLFVDDGLRVEVTDGSPHGPSVRDYGTSAGTGRGLMLLEEMADDWGVVADDPGKTVWCQITADDEGPREGDHGGHESPTGIRAPVPRVHRDSVSVRLIGVPLLLHEAWREHTESLLRELLLANLEDASSTDPIAEHAEASDAIALLAEHIPASGVHEDACHIMISAVEPLMTSPMVEVPVPPESVQHFATLERTILTALEMADQGRLLNPPSQPEVQGLRAWLCRQVIGQSQGAPPEPWSMEREPRSRHPRSLAWDVESVRSSVQPMIAADDEDRIVAVSPAALDILGYDDALTLVGKRLIAIVPERYRQAHLAGFTLHFLTGRAPLLDRPVVVPALRRDGDEVDVELTVRSQRAGGGRTVFVAELRRLA
jgi:PAS domain S-box-containing protein